MALRPRPWSEKWLTHFIDLAFFLVALTLLWALHYCIRRSLGHERFKGVWYDARQIQLLKQELYDGVRSGRIPDSKTMAFLDRHIYGKESEIRHINGNGWL